MAYFDYTGKQIGEIAGVTNNVFATAAGQTMTAVGALPLLKDVAGGDALIGGSGTTDFIVIDPNTVVQQGAHTGVSTVETWISYTLPTGVDDLYEEQNNATAAGNAGQNLLVAAGNKDVLIGGGGNDVMVDAGAGSDRFLFSPGDGHDVIYGFQSSGPTQDFVNLANFGYTSFSQISPLLSQDGADALLTLSSTDSILIRNTQVSSLTASDFLLALDTSKMSMTFDDEFNSLSLYDPATGAGTWKTNFMFGAQSGYNNWISHTLTPNAEQEIYVDPSYAGSGTTPLGINPFSIANGVLTITAAQTPVGDLSALNNYQYTSGLLTTQNSFAQTYGYFEMKAELPTGQGVWPAFWLLPETAGGTDEIDVMENLGGNTVYQTAHYDTLSGPALSAWDSVVSNLSGGFHTYGMLWTAQDLVWYIDGKAVAEMATPAGMNQPMYMLVNLAIGGVFPGNAPSTFTSAQMEIDYIRAYNLNGATASSQVVSNQSTAAYYVATSSTDLPTDATVDTISSAYSYALPTSFAHTLVLTGTAALTATGNALGDHIIGNGGNDTLIGGVGSDVLDASAGGNVLLNGGPGGVDTLIGGAGNDTFIVANSSDVVTALAGHQNLLETSVNFHTPVNIQAVTVLNAASVSVWANDSGDTMTASSGYDVFHGGAGNDSFVSGSGMDTFVAGAGIDTFWITSPGDVIQGIQVGSKDVVQTTVSYYLPDNAMELVLVGSGNLTGWSNNTGATLAANSGNDLLYGGAGNDSFVSGSGVDTMVGGAGSDTYFVQNSADVIIPGGGGSTIWADVSYHLPDNIQIGGLTGSANLSLWAGAGAEHLYGNSGANVLYAGAGADTLTGGAGNDTFVFGVIGGKDVVSDFGQNGAQETIDISAALNAGYTTSVAQIGGNAIITLSNGETITLNNVQASTLIATGQGYAINQVVTTYTATSSTDLPASAAIDTVDSAYSYSLPANTVHTLVLTGSGNLTATGNALGDHIVGNTGNDTLIGGGGSDVLDASKGGSDLLNGGAGGLDTFIAGAGADTFVVSNPADVIQGVPTGSRDVVQSSVSYQLADNVSQLVLTGSGDLTGWSNSTGATLVGNSGNNWLLGGAGNDSFVSGSGVDTMIGGVGSDTFVVSNAADVIIHGSGTSTVWSSVSYHLPDTINFAGLTGSADLSLWAGAGDITLQANAGNDVLYGGSGVDTFIAGAGVDTFVVANSAYVIKGVPTGSRDVVESSVSYQLTNNVSQLVMTGSGDLTGWSNGTGATLVGNSGNNWLLGGAGNDSFVSGSGVDTMIGGVGSDTFVVSNAADVIIHGSGTSTVWSSVSYHLPDTINFAGLTGSADLSLWAGAGNITLQANAGNDVLYGGPGVDTFVAGAGVDTFVVSNPADVIKGVPTGSHDVVQSSVSYQLADNVSQLVMTGSGDLTGWSNSTGATLVGNSGDNWLLGGAGNDSFVSGSGVDTMIGGVGSDTFVVSNAADVIIHGGGTSTVLSSVSYHLPDTINFAGLTGSADLSLWAGAGDITLHGNAGNNHIYAGSGVDVMSGGAGNDSFVFGLGSGKDTITDFGQAGDHDAIDVSAYLNAGYSASVSNVGTNAVITISNGETITLLGVQASSLTHTSTGFMH